MTWWRRRRRPAGPPSPATPPPAPDPNEIVARTALERARRDLAATVARVDSYTAQVRRELGGSR